MNNAPKCTFGILGALLWGIDAIEVRRIQLANAIEF